MIFNKQETAQLSNIEFQEVVSNAGLSLQQMVILMQIAAGYNQTEVAKKLKISARRVRTVVADIRKKMLATVFLNSN